MDVHALGFSYAPPPLVSVSDLLSEIRLWHKQKKKWGDLFRLISFSGRRDKNGFYRGGVLSVKDEKVALCLLMDEQGEPVVKSKKNETDLVDFNCFLFRRDANNPEAILRGLFTTYFGSMSIRQWKYFMNFISISIIKEKIKKILESDRKQSGTKSINKYIEKNNIKMEGEFKQIIVKRNFTELVKIMATLKKIQLGYEVVSSQDDEDAPLSDMVNTIRNTEVIILNHGTRGAFAANRIYQYILNKGASSAKAIGVMDDGSTLEADFFTNFEIFWEKDLDEIKESINISIELFSVSPIFSILSDGFHDDPRLADQN